MAISHDRAEQTLPLGKRGVSSLLRTRCGRTLDLMVAATAHSTNGSHSHRRIHIGTALVGASLIACGPHGHESGPQISVGHTYQFRIRATSRPASVPELTAVIGPVRDSITGALTVDSVRGDSVFGRYEAPLPLIGLFALPLAGTEQRFSARSEHNRLSIQLNPNVTDASVYFDGTARNGRIEGEWRDAQSTRNGTFTIEL